MSDHGRIKPVLYAEDEEDDVFLVQYAFGKAQVECPLKVIPNGKAVVEYLSGMAPYEDRAEHPLPILLLLDLNLPLLSGMEVLEWVRGQAAFQDLPVVILSSSEQPKDKDRARQLGANDYHLKPSNPEHFIRFAKDLNTRWLQSGNGIALGKGTRPGG